MNGRYISADFSEFQNFFNSLGNAAKGDFKQALGTFLEGLGDEFLRMVQDEFISRHKNTGYGLLISSFSKDDDHNVWRYSDSNLTLEVGSSVNYAGYVNDGHRTFDPSKTSHFTLKSGEEARFVPGRWQGNRFIYDPGADGGMVLKYKWVEGLHFWEAAMHSMEALCPALLEVKLQQWINSYFGG